MEGSAKRVRTVDSLTEDQIHRKRNVDRRAQRAFRQRLKDSAAKLESQLAQSQEECQEKDQQIQLLREENKLLNQQASAAQTNGFYGAADPTAWASYDTTIVQGTRARLGSRLKPKTRQTLRNLRDRLLKHPPPSLFTQDTRTDPVLNWASRTAHSVPSLHLPPTCPLDQILHDLLHSSQHLLEEGTSLEIVLGPWRPNVKSIIYDQPNPSLHPISSVLSSVLSTYPGFKKTERLAFFHIMSLTMKWQISRTRESYLALPWWLRPTPAQLTTPHAIWIDNIPWPDMRDVLIERAGELPHPTFSPYFSPNVSVNWPHDLIDAVSNVGDEAVLHTIFEKHIYNLNNWVMSPEFMERFPFMQSTVEIPQ